MTPLPERLREPTAGWRTSTHSTAALVPACLQVATGWRGEDGFVIDRSAGAAPPPAGPAATDESAIYLQFTDSDDLLEDGGFVVEFGSPEWEGSALDPQISEETADDQVRPLPIPPLGAEFDPIESAFETQYNGEHGHFAIADFRLPADTPSESGGGRWAGINRSIPGITSRPAISQDTWTADDDDTAAYDDRDRYVQEHYPHLHELNPTGSNINCNQALIAVDYMLDGSRTIRVPPTVRSAYYGLFRLKDKHQGRSVDVANYDDVIAAVSNVSGSRGAVYVSFPDDFAHVFNVVDTPDGVVFLDGQSGTLAELRRNVDRIGLLLYHPNYPLDPAPQS
ncbi:toxin glutamine deamidase domain-containing protein [Actinomadura sp. DC4]|uniref:toxin glutamine deamidase domain-containing protein n=1 Tax=Actinomadura sp. DC4 TaxID=3055069 RepID=UPI0025B070CE|nr:toxin glutamine deamidase domain-containing protein [Actinomadura sp. DC4]MDN3355581.1 toxin glutamine deamidase domain-containing protein [Actinomadura sp. DC4]